MSIAQLRSFHYVATYRSFSLAAQALNRTQPAVSDSVGRLEQEYNVLLFNRNNRQISLTERGKDLFQITAKLFTIEEQAIELLSKSQRLGTTHFRLIADAPLYITSILRQFREAHPQVTVSLQIGNTEEVFSALSNYEADVGVLGSKKKRSGFEVQSLGRSAVVAFCSKKDSMAKMASATLDELAKQSIVMREAGSRTRQKIEEAANKRGITLVPSIETEGREGVRELVAGGAGIGFVARSEIGWDTRVKAIPISDVSIFINETLVCLSSRCDVPVISAFMKIASERQAGQDG